jgi:predicted O-methyltransferase YrrM
MEKTISDRLAAIRTLLTQYQRVSDLSPNGANASALPFRTATVVNELYAIYPDLRNKCHLEATSQLIGSIIARDRVLQQMAKNALARCGALEVLDQSSRHSDAGAFSADFVDLVLLYELVRIVRPESILELGSGLSTLMLATSQHDCRNNGRLTAIEPNERWAQHTEEMLPDALSSVVEVLRGAPKDYQVGRWQSRIFSNTLSETPDFIYVDGAPSGARFAGMETVIELERELKPGCVIAIDGRMKAFSVFTRGGPLTRKYAVFSQGLFVANPIEEDENFIGPIWGLDRYFNTIAVLIE